MDLFNEYFKLFHQSYPFLDRRTALAEAESWVHIFDKDTVDMDFRSLKLYLIMALGAEFFDRKRHAYTILDQFRVPYSDALQLCLSKPDMESIQILLLLAIYSTYDPSGWPPWIITSVLGRQAFALGLNHRIKAPFGSSLFETGTEFRYRLFWCIFCIDRWVSVAFGLPLAIDDNDYDVPFPSVTTAEFAALDQSDRLTTLQVARQVITMCELQGQTLSRVHIGGFRATSPDCPTRLRTIERFRAQAENWYTQGCLLARLDTQKPVHNTITWLNVIFHSALILLYYPSQANADLELELPEMLQIAQKYILCAYAHFQGGHLPLSHITLNSFWVVYRILVYCYSCHQAVTNTAETEDIIIRCVTMLDAFSPGWKKHVEPCRLLYCRFANLLRKAYPYIVREELSPTSNDDPLNCPENDNLDTIIKDSESMVRKVMGASSIYSNLTRQHER